MQLVNLTIDHQGMPRIVPPLKARNHIRALREPIHDLAFSLITPLGADNNDVGHDLHPLRKNPASHSGQRGGMKHENPGLRGAP